MANIQDKEGCQCQGQDLGHGKVNVKSKIPDKKGCQFQSQDPGHEEGSNVKAKI
jgi:hypothetical protein